MPAYLRDLFGTFQVGAIHGRLLTAWSAAGVAGPLIVNGILDTKGEPGTLTSGDYAPALITMVCVLAVGFVANLLISPSTRASTSPRATTARDPRRRGRISEREEPGARLPPAGRLAGHRDPLAYGVYETVSKAIDLFG